jgi:hypothetical protein
MAGQSYVLDKTYQIEDAAGVGQFIAVVVGANDGGCKKPAAANAKGFLGFTQEAQTHQNKGVAVRKIGISRAIAAAAIANGDWVAIDGTTGKVKSVQTAVDAVPGTAADVQVIGKAEAAASADGDIIPVFIHQTVAKVAAS